eukprot:gene2662-5224_t
MIAESAEDISRFSSKETRQNESVMEGREYFKKGDYAKAAESFKLALESFKDGALDCSYEAAEVHRNLASAYMMQASYDQAQPHFASSLEIAESLARNNPSYRINSLLIRSIGALGTFLLNQGMIEEAEPHCIRCLALAEETYGMDHYRLLEPVRAVVFLCEKQGNIDEAIRLLKRAYIVAAYTRGPVHTETQKLIDDLLRLLHSIGNLRAAEAYATLNLNNLRDFSAEPNGLPIADSCCKLAKIYLESDQPVRAEEYLTAALEIQETLLGPAHGDVGETVYMLASSYFKMERVDAITENLYTRAMEIFEKVYGNESPQ